MRIISALMTLVVATAVSLVVAACSDTNAASAASALDAKPVLAALTTNVFVPGLNDLETQALALQSAVGDWDSVEPTEQRLMAAQDAWKSARNAWRLIDAYRFGPVESLRITAACDFSPTNTSSLETFLESTNPITAEAVEQLGANLRGFGAIEYLMFDNAGNPSMLAKFVGTSGARRRKYVQIASLLVHDKTAELKAAWGDGKGPGFAREVAEAGGASVTFPSAKSAIDQIVNSAIFSAELVTNTKIGKPAGKKTGGVPQPADVESARSDNTIAELDLALAGVMQVYEGSPSSGSTESRPGIAALVRAKNAALDVRVRASFALARAKVLAIPKPFRTAIVDHPTDVEAAYQAVKAAKNVMSTEVTSVLGTTLKFNDNDGD